MVGGKLYDTPTSEDFGLLKSLAITSKCIGRLMMQIWNHLVKNQLKCELIISIFYFTALVNQIIIFSYTPQLVLLLSAKLTSTHAINGG